MPYTWEVCLYVAAILCAGGFLQSIAGFAYGLFAIPFLMWLSIPATDAVVIVLVASMMQTILGCWTLRRSIPHGYILRPFVLRLFCALVGIFVLRMIIDYDKELIHIIIGVILITSVLSIWTLQKRGLSNIHSAWLYVASSVGGFMSGFIGMGGPPMVLWVMSQNWESKTVRAFLFAMFATLGPFQIVFFVTIFGSGVWWAALLGLCCAPLVLLGSYFGMRIGNALSIVHLRKIAYILLLILGLKSIISYYV